MGRELYESEPQFRQTLDDCAALLDQHLEEAVLDVLFDRDGKGQLIQETEYTQPILFAIEVALASLWQHWGVQPDVLLGHSVGEFAAACIGNYLSLEDGARLIAQRGKLMQRKTADGKMLAVLDSVSESEAAAAGLEITARNAPRQTILGGAAKDVEAFAAACTARGLTAIELKVNCVFHSSWMDPIREEFDELCQGFQHRDGDIPFLSNLEGKLVTADVLNDGYWGRHLREAVDFQAGVKALAQMGCQCFIEIGPGRKLQGLVRKQIRGEVDWLSSLHKGRSDREVILESLGRYHIQQDVNWEAFYEGQNLHRLPLPTYPFEKRYFDWPGRKTTSKTAVSAKPKEMMARGRSLIGQKVQSTFFEQTLFQSSIATDSLPWFVDHQIYGQVILSGSCYISMSLEAARQCFPSGKGSLKNVIFPSPCILEPEANRQIQMVVSPLPESTSLRMQVVSTTEVKDLTKSSWLHHSDALWTADDQQVSVYTGADPRYLKKLKKRCPNLVSRTELRDRLQAHQVHLGPGFHWANDIYTNETEAICKMICPDEIKDLSDYPLHPGLVDSCFQMLAACITQGSDATFVPFRMEQFRFHGCADQRELWCCASLRDEVHPQMVSITGDMELRTSDGSLVAEFIGFESRRAEASSLLKSIRTASHQDCYEQVWEAKEGLLSADSDLGVEGKWLIVSDHQGLGPALARQLQEAGAEPTLLLDQDDESSTDSSLPRVKLDFGKETELHAFLSDFNQADSSSPLRGILYLTALDMPSNETNSISQNELEAALFQLCGRALNLVKAVEKIVWHKAPRLIMLTQQAQQVIEGDVQHLSLFQTPLIGLTRVILSELFNLPSLYIDWQQSSRKPMEDAALLMRLLNCPNNVYQVAVRAETCYEPQLSRHKMNPPTDVLSIQPDASYLITGGYGYIGCQTALMLAKEGAKNIVVASRNPKGGRSLALREELTQMGVQLHFIQTDVSDAQQIQQLIQTIKEELPPLKGIVHAAGAIDDGILSRQNWDRYQNILLPKVVGGWYLHEYTQDLSLDFFVGYSSMVTLFGSPSQSTYASGNAFLDGLAHFRQGRQQPALSINWGPWDGEGMAGSLNEGSRQRLHQLGLDFIAAEEGMDFLRLALLQGRAQLGFIQVDWATFFKRNTSEALESFLIPLRPTDQSGQENARGYLQKLAKLDATSRTEALRQALQEMVNGVLGKAADEHVDPEM
ncbi:MAG: SDR family NAD(P)-dependent oxidoreductase, partial [Bacteroidota bacterium]